MNRLRGAHWVLLSIGLSCGGIAVIDPGGSAGDGGTGGTGGDAQTGDGVMCGPVGPCTFTCCIDQTGSYCATGCDAPGIFAFSCDGPEDCGTRQCCGDRTGSECAESCFPDRMPLCHDNSDCTSGNCSGPNPGELLGFRFCE